MKKVAVIITVYMIVLLCASCSFDDTQSTQPETSHEDALIGMANPMVKTDADGIMQKLGFKFNVLSGAQNVRYFIISNEMAQMQFKLNGIEFTARIKSADDFEDISGMYYTWDKETKCTVAGCDAKVMRYIGKEEAVDVCFWYDASARTMHSLSAQGKDLDGFDIRAIAEQIYVPARCEVK